MAAPMTRRDFASTVMATGALTAIPSLAADDKPMPQVNPENDPVELLLKIIQHQYPHEKLEGAALDEIRLDLQHLFRRSARLSDFPLSNGDEPAFSFVPYRNPEQP